MECYALCICNIWDAYHVHSSFRIKLTHRLRNLDACLSMPGPQVVYVIRMMQDCYNDMRRQTQSMAYKNCNIRGEGGQKTMIQVQLCFSDLIL